MKTGEKMRDIFIKKDDLRKFLQSKIFGANDLNKIEAYYEILRWVNLQ